MICRACLRARAAGTLALLPQTVPRVADRIQPISTLLVRQARAYSSPALSRLAIFAVARRTYSSSSTSSPATSTTTTAEAEAETPQTTDSAASQSLLPKPDFATEGEAAVWERLASSDLAPTALFVQDISGGCGSMYGIEIASERFRGLGMLKQQRLVNAALGDMVAQWHGVQIRTKVP